MPNFILSYNQTQYTIEKSFFTFYGIEDGFVGNYN